MKIVIHSEVDWKFGLLESYNQFFVVDFVCVPSMKEPHYICPNDNISTTVLHPKCAKLQIKSLAVPVRYMRAFAWLIISLSLYYST